MPLRISQIQVASPHATPPNRLHVHFAVSKMITIDLSLRVALHLPQIGERGASKCGISLAARIGQNSQSGQSRDPRDHIRLTYGASGWRHPSLGDYPAGDWEFTVGGLPPKAQWWTERAHWIGDGTDKTKSAGKWLSSAFAPLTSSAGKLLNGRMVFGEDFDRENESWLDRCVVGIICISYEFHNEMYTILLREQSV